MSGVIDVVEITGANCVEWKIPHFFPTSQDTAVYKSVISLFHGKWALTVYPRGAYGKTPDDVIVVVAVFSNSDVDFSTKKVLLEVKDYGEAFRSRVEEGKDDEGHHKIWTWLYDSNKLQMLLSQDNVLRGKVIISSNEENSNASSTAVAACQAQLLCSTVHFCRNFQDLLISGRKSDASIEVQGRLFNVHKLILETCSPVFCALFDHDMSEKNKGIVKVDDCDPEIFQNFLECLYSGKLEKSSTDCLIELYKISNKYCVSDLKEKCSDFMVEDLCEDTVLEVYAAADMCHDVQLKTSVETFLAGNIKKIIRTEKWKNLLSENPSFVAKILTKVVED